MAIRWKRIRGLVVTLLREFVIAEAPVDVEAIAKAKGLSIWYSNDQDGNTSGFLLVRGEQSVVGVNETHSPVRQRFTVAHELGHFLLHRHKMNNVHVDHGFQVKLRNDLSAQGTNTEEREANYFAAELLMPANFLTADLKDVQNLDLEGDEFIQNLAKKYQVSQQAMLFRLANLRYITP